MRGKHWQRWLRAGLGAVLVGLAVAGALGLLVEAVILLAAVVACALSLVPLLVDRPRIPYHLDRRTAHGSSRTWSRGQGA